MKRIVMSLGAIVFVGAMAWGATGAFFTDTETSAGNTFTAGGISMQVDSTQHYNNAICVANTDGPGFHWALAANATTQPDQYPAIGSACTGTFAATTLGPTNQFFNFNDIKPADVGEDTISIHNIDNPAWMCANIAVTSNVDGTSTTTPGSLATEIQFATWVDNASSSGAVPGDNIHQSSEPLTFGPAAFGATGSTTLPIADSTHGSPLTASSTNFIGVAWCAGTMTVDGTTGAIGCNGASMGNEAQHDSMTANITLTASQARNQPNFSCGTSTAGGPQTIGVGANDLDAGPRATAVTDGSGKWFMYNDTNDTIDNTLGTFVAGPSTPPAGTGSVAFTLGASPLDRKDIATYAYQGTLLSAISALNFSAYSHSGVAGATESPFLVFDVDFATSTTALYSGRLVYVPSANGAVPQDTWNTYSTLGTGLWNWSGFAKGPDKLAATADDNTWPDGNTSPNRTWASIVAAFPNAKISATAGLLGVRVGEPGPTNYTGNVDKFQINTGSGLKTYDFGN
jgi:predicted ribosomally synthesized peptide with SipW-like signal peptide